MRIIVGRFLVLDPRKCCTWQFYAIYKETGTNHMNNIVYLVPYWVTHLWLVTSLHIMCCSLFSGKTAGLSNVVRWDTSRLIDIASNIRNRPTTLYKVTLFVHNTNMLNQYLARRSVVDIQVNGHQLTYVSCDGNTNCYLALFPNVRGSTPLSNYGGGSIYSHIISAISLSSVSIPINYFLFWETHWGGCGVYAQSGGGRSNEGASGAAIGFRWSESSITTPWL